MPVSSNTSYVDTYKRENKSHGSIHFPAACYSAAFPETAIPLHWHDEIELLYVVKGKLLVQFGSERIVLNEGEGLFINSDIIHKTDSANGKYTLIHTIVFHPRLIAEPNNQNCWNKYIRPLTDNSRIPVLKLSEDSAWQEKILSGIRTSWESIAFDRYGFELRARNELSEVLLTLTEHQEVTGITMTGNDLRNNERLKKILMYIHEHYSEEITLDDIAQVTMISRSSCLRLFRETLDTTPIGYVNQYRLMAAARYLEETDWLISEIGYRCGFNEMGYFSAQFRKIFGMSPRNYRRSLAEESHE